MLLSYPPKIVKQIPPEDSTPIRVWTDGSTMHNGKPNAFCGWSFVAIGLNGRPYIRYGSYVPNLQSNNRAEIMGVMATLIDLLQYNRPIIVYSDSQYVVKTVNEWRKGWFKKDINTIKNRALFLKLFKLVDSSRVTLEWVRGHNGDVGNELADRWAANALNGFKPTAEQLEKADIVFVETVHGVKDEE